MICADCKKTLTRAALTIGAASFGPVCAKRYIVRPTRTGHAVFDRLPRVKAPVVDEKQLALEFA